MVPALLYALLFLVTGLMLARRIFPDASPGLALPLGCGYGIAMLAAFPAVFALGLDFGVSAVGLAGITALLILLALVKSGVRLTGWQKNPDDIVLLVCVLPLMAVTCYLLHTHILHAVDGTFHTGQSCYGDLPMHLGFIEYIAQSGEFPPTYPLLGGAHRFGYPFLCETVSSVFRILGADLRTACLLPMVPAFLSAFGMFWQLAPPVLGSRYNAWAVCAPPPKPAWPSTYSLWAVDSALSIFWAVPGISPASSPAFIPPPPTIPSKTSSGSTRWWI